MFNTMNVKNLTRTIEFKIEKIFKAINYSGKEKKCSSNEKNKIFKNFSNNDQVHNVVNKSKNLFELISSDEQKILIRVINKQKKDKINKKSKSNDNLITKCKRNRSTDSKGLLNEDRILDYDYFLEEFYRNESKKSKDKKNIKLASNPIKKKEHNKDKTLQKTKKNLTNIKKKGKKKITPTKNLNIYDIDNFVIQNNARRIHQKHVSHDIPIPIYKELELDYYECDTKMYPDKENNTSDEVYTTYHQIYEQRERDYKLSFFKKKKSCEKDQKSITGISMSDHITTKSIEDIIPPNLKIRISYDPLTNGKVKI